MTASQLHDAGRLIPGAYELNARPHRATRAAHPVPVTASEGVRPHAAAAGHVVAPSDRPTTLLGRGAAILRDVALLAGIIYGVAVLPALAVWGIKGVAALVMATVGRH